MVDPAASPRSEKLAEKSAEKLAEQQPEQLPGELVRIYGRLDKRAFGLAVGSVAGLAVLLLTLVKLLVIGDAGGSRLHLLAQYFPGFEPTWGRMWVGVLWSAWAGFVLGWFAAFTRNAVIGMWLFVIRTRSQLRSNRGFLDQI